jgi:BASS family bile acid:Na+ symporter
MQKKIFDWVHHNFLLAILLCYVVGAFFPTIGISISKIHFGIIGGEGDALKLSIPFLMISLLLFNSALGINQNELKNLKQHPAALVWGLILNFCIPLLVILAVSCTMTWWHNPDELQNVLVGLALIGAMPIAASSTAWTQKGNGNLALSLGLILISTIFSPLTTPIALHFSGNLTTGDYSEDLHLLANGNTNLFLILGVVLPSFMGVIVHFFIKEKNANKLRTNLKEINLFILLLLNYFNASNVLPKVIENPDWDFLLMIFVITILLCVSLFAAGNLAGKLLKTGDSNRIALMFGLGMNNNGVGLVLASMALSDHPLIMLPIIIYNLLQHIIAGIVDKRINKD